MLSPTARLRGEDAHEQMADCPYVFKNISNI